MSHDLPPLTEKIASGAEGGLDSDDLLRTLRRADLPIIGRVLGRNLDKAKGWMTLTRAVRDNSCFKPEDTRTILRRAVRFWLEAPSYDNDWFKALEELRLSSEDATSVLREVVKEIFSAPAARDVVAGLHLARRLTVLPADVADCVRSHPELHAMLPDLVFFGDNEGLAGLVEGRGLSGLVESLSALESQSLYESSLVLVCSSPDTVTRRAEATLALLWRKVRSDLISRERFAEPRRQSDVAIYFDTTRELVAKGPLHEVGVPFNALRALGTGWTPHHARGRSLLCSGLDADCLESGQEAASTVEHVQSWTSHVLAAGIAPFAEEGSDPNEIATEIASRYLGHDSLPGFDRYSGGDFGRYFCHYFGHEFVRDFVRYFVNDLDRDSGRNFVRDLGRGFSRYFIRDFLRDFGRDFASYFARDFGRYFGSEFGRALGRHPGKDFGHDVGRDFVRFFVRFFGHDFDGAFGVDLDASDWEERFIVTLEQEENVLKLVHHPRLWDYLAIVSEFEASTEESSCVAVRMTNPLVIPVCLLDVWRTAALGHIFSLVRHLAVAFPKGDFQDSDVDNWLNCYSVDVYAVAFSWEERVRDVAKTLDSLHGVRGALLLSHAAFAALMTGMPLDGPIWQGLVERRDRDDVLVEASYLFYEICRFRDGEANVRRLDEIARASTGEVRGDL